MHGAQVQVSRTEGALEKPNVRGGHSQSEARRVPSAGSRLSKEHPRLFPCSDDRKAESRDASSRTQR